MTPFEAGQRVVCIADDWWAMLPFGAVKPLGSHPAKDGSYTVSNVVPFGPAVFLYLQGFDPGYHAIGFRPLVSDHTELFQSWVAPVPADKRVKEDA